ncbi:Malectin/receptor-like protein kinase family protein [Gossypium australe]|uniref:Malectin/receptor-like protein kinase family protein n=1 Tax=Gossypium australe TaxID=47621 RepID=A0A5B6VV90_9ROSI|nr:Malectin/receptor-like protein kinase family protein [Gossypium australe]
MGTEFEVIEFNLTWLFQVDANFTYIVRLHLYEIVHDKLNQRVSNVYINNKLTQVDPDPLDILAWTKVKGIPTYRGYAIVVFDSQGNEMVRICIVPSTLLNPEFYDVLLNGVEIFNLNYGNKNLAGSNPQPSAMFLQSPNELSKSVASKSNNGVATAWAAERVASAFVVVAGETHIQLHGNSYIPKRKSRKSNNCPVSALSQGLPRHF